jgi:hypothetical protein
MNILVEDPVLIKNSDNSLSCNFKIQYVALPVAVPNPSVSAYGLRCYLQCEDGTFGKLQGQQSRFDANSDPPPTDVIIGTVSLVPPPAGTITPSEHYSIGGKPPFVFVNVNFIVEEFRAGIIQHQEAFSFKTVVVP